LTPARLVLKKLFQRPEKVGQRRKTANSSRNGATKNSPAQRSFHGCPVCGFTAVDGVPGVTRGGVCTAIG
jgi:hypothetical protein